MASAEQVKALRSHAEGDDARFYAIAIQVAAQAARGGHRPNGNFESHRSASLMIRPRLP